MKIAIFFPYNVLTDGSRYYTKTYEHYMVTELARHFQATDLVVFLKESEVIEESFQEIAAADMNVIGLSGYREERRLLTKSGWEIRFLEIPYMCLEITRLFLRKGKQWDAIVIWDPYFTNQFLFLLTRIFRNPSVLFLGALHEKTVLLGAKNRPLNQRIACYIKYLFYRFMVPVMVRSLPTVVAGMEMHDLYRKTNDDVFNIVTTNIRRSSIDQDALKKRNYLSGNVRLLSVCRVTPEKGIEYLIEAVSKLNGKVGTVTVDIVGPIINEDYHRHLLQMCTDFSVADRVRFRGRVKHGEELMGYYSEADIFVISSISEGSPKVIPEAMARGLPIIGTNVGGVPGLVKHNVNGLIVEAGNAQKLSEAILRLALDPALRKEMGRYSLQKAEEYCIEEQMADFAGIIESSLGKAGSTGEGRSSGHGG